MELWHLITKYIFKYYGTNSNSKPFTQGLTVKHQNDLHFKEFCCREEKQFSSIIGAN